MRIIAGTFRSRRLEAPSKLHTRPTSDRLRETLFNVLAPRIEGAFFLDLYAGSGAVGLEALSRGAAQIVFVEKAPAALKALRRNLTNLGLTKGITIEPGSVGAYLRRAQTVKRGFDVVFLDPPYDACDEYQLTLEWLGGAAAASLSGGAVVIAEHRRKDRLEERYGMLVRQRVLEQGDATLSFYTGSRSASPA